MSPAQLQPPSPRLVNYIDCRDPKLGHSSCSALRDMIPTSVLRVIAFELTVHDGLCLPLALHRKTVPCMQTVRLDLVVSHGAMAHQAIYDVGHATWHNLTKRHRMPCIRLSGSRPCTDPACLCTPSPAATDARSSLAECTPSCISARVCREVNVRHSSFIKNLEYFDAKFFRISPAETRVGPASRLHVKLTDTRQSGLLAPQKMHALVTGFCPCPPLGPQDLGGKPMSPAPASVHTQSRAARKRRAGEGPGGRGWASAQRSRRAATPCSGRSSRWATRRSRTPQTWGGQAGRPHGSDARGRIGEDPAGPGISRTSYPRGSHPSLASPSSQRRQPARAKANAGRTSKSLLQSLTAVYARPLVFRSW